MRAAGLMALVVGCSFDVSGVTTGEDPDANVAAAGDARAPDAKGPPPAIDAALPPPIDAAPPPPDAPPDCGEPGLQCCFGGWCNTGDCGPGYVCSTCGGDGQSCCDDGDPCSSGQCASGTCESCGGFLEQCCDDSPECGMFLYCDDSFNTCF
jgi:hypothetical protein